MSSHIPTDAALRLAALHLSREHSRKPDKFYELVVRCTPLAIRRVDLFARMSQWGFDSWGNEAGKFDKEAA